MEENLLKHPMTIYVNFFNCFDNIHGLGKPLETVLMGPEKIDTHKKFGVEF